MKSKFIVAIILLSFLSCRHPEKKAVINDNRLVGKWGIYGMGSAMCNVCPDIIFSKNHSGYIKRSDPQLLDFNWKISDSTLIIRHQKNEDKDNIIDDGIYKMMFSNKKIYEELSLTDTKSGIKYILRN